MNSKENGPVPDNDGFDDMLKREAQRYRSGGEPPADLMWSRIQGDVARAIDPRRRSVTRFWPALAVGAGLAATLLIGINIGRRSALDSTTTASNTAATSVVAVEPAGLGGARMRHVVFGHLGQVEVF